MSDLKEVIEDLKEKLVDYVSSQIGVSQAAALESGKKISCFLPAHTDSTPSMSLDKKRNRIKCFGCNAYMDIFHVAAALENLPITGTEFYTETVKVLAERFAIPMPEVRITQKQAEIATHKKFAYEAFDYIREVGDTTYANKRGITDAVCREIGVGSVDYNDFVEAMISRGAPSKEFIRDELGYKPGVFSSNVTTVTLHDKYGKPVSFTARAHNWTKESPFPKFDSVRTTSAFQKGSWLFNIHTVKREKHDEALLVEGHFDALRLYASGVRNVLALGGIAFTEHHTTVIEDARIKRLVLSLDNDSAGQDSLLSIIKAAIESRPRFKLSILDYDKTFKDPEDCINAKGLQYYLDSKQLPAFSFYSNHVWTKRAPSTDDEKSDVADELVKLISLEPSEFRRTQMISSMATLTGFDHGTITKSVSICIAEKSREFNDRINRLKKSTLSAIKNNDPSAFVELIKSVSDEADTLYKEFSDVDDGKAQAIAIDVIDSLSDPGNSAYLDRRFIKSGYPTFDLAFDGIPGRGVYTALLGNSSSGKSSLIVDMIPRMFAANKDLIVLYHTIDDPVDTTLFRMSVALSRVDSDQYRHGKVSPVEKARIKTAAAYLRQKIDKSELDIRDTESGFTLQYAEKWIESVRRKNPEHRIFYIVDNLYNAINSGKDKRQLVEEASRKLKVEIAQRLGVGVLATVEPRKLDPTRKYARLTKQDIKESGKIEMDAHCIWLLHNGKPPGRKSEISTECGRDRTWIHPNGSEYPIVEVEIAKDKDHGAGLWRLKYDPPIYKFSEISCNRDSNM